MEKENKELRDLLWMRHGCSIHKLYGDDGEMQCLHCQIDFKRDSAEKISRIFTKLGFDILIKHAENLEKRNT